MPHDGHTWSDAVDDPCQHVLAAVRSDRALEEPLAAHARDCPVCSALLDVGAPPTSETTTSPELGGMWTSLEAELGREESPVARLRSLRTPIRAALVAAVVVLVPMLVLLVRGRVDASVYPGTRLVLDVAVMAVPAVVLVAVVMRPLHRRPWPRWVAPAAVVLAAIGVLVGSMLEPAHQAHAASLGGTGPELVRRAVACLATGSVLGAPVVVATSLLLRRQGRLRLPPPLAVVLAGLTGSLAIFLHCPLVAPVHLLVGHATVLGAYLVLAAVVVRR